MKNYLVIGGGISGVAIAHQLDNRGHSFDLVDNNPDFNSSKVAAGFWNPIVFKRLTLSYKADLLIPKLVEFYSDIEKKLDKTFLHYKPQLKIFSSIQERRRFIDKAIVSEVSHFLDEEVIEEIAGIKSPYGMGRVIGTGYINTVEYIEKSIDYFKSKNSFIKSKVDYSEIEYGLDCLLYRDTKYDKIVFCEGYFAVNNPLFPELKLKPTKGEILILEIPKLSQNFAFAKSAGLIPIGNNKFIAGSTYNWEDMSEETTESAKRKLLYNLSDYLEYDFTIIDQQAGIRPSSFDRRPILGQSKIEERAYILNGFGTKGIMYAPYFSEMLLNKIDGVKEIDEEINYNRY